MPAHPTIAAQEREAADIFRHADRRGPPTSSVVRSLSLFLAPSYLYTTDRTLVEKRCLGSCDPSLPLSTCITQALSCYQYCQVFQGVS